MSGIIEDTSIINDEQQLPTVAVSDNNESYANSDENNNNSASVETDAQPVENQQEQQVEVEEDELAALLENSNNNNNNNNDEAEENLSPPVLVENDDNNNGFPVYTDEAHNNNSDSTVKTSAKKSKHGFPLPAGTTIESLFGPNFKPRPNPVSGSEDVPLDPSEVDFGSIIQSQFGIEDWASLAFLPVKDEHTIDPNYLVFQEGEGGAKAVLEEDLEAYIIEQEGLVARDEVAEIFGPGAVKLVVESLRRGAAPGQKQLPTQVISLPRPPAAKFVAPDADQKTKADDNNSESWLLHLPTIYPNRRSAHIERGPYVPGLTTVRKQSTDRAIYTPLNVLRWAFDESRDLSLSNARLVQWSTGVWTLHIGSDVYAIAPDKTQTLVVVGQEIENTVPEFAPPGVEHPDRIFVETAPYTKRVQLLPSGGDAGHSVETFLVAEGRITSVQKNPESVVKLVTAPVTVSKPPVPGQPKDTKSVRIEGSNELAEFIALKDKEREKELAKNIAGRAPTIFDRLAYDAGVLETIRTAQMGDAADFSNLVNKFKEEVAAATAASTRNQQFGNNTNQVAGGGKSGKFDRRDLTLGDDESLLDNDQDGDEDEEEDLEQLLSSGTRRKRNGEAVKETKNNNQNNNDQVDDDQLLLQQQQEDSSLASKEDILERLLQMKRTPGLSDELVDEIEGLSNYFNETSGMSLESMKSEVKKIEEKVVQNFVS